MAPSIVHLPNGMTLTVQPSFGGLFFKANDLNPHHGSAFPPGWTVILHSEDDEEDHVPPSTVAHTNPNTYELDASGQRRHHIHRFKRPSLRNDHIFISSISNPSNESFKPPTSPTRQIAMMFWATLWWYFHQPAPDHKITTAASAATADEGKPKGEWRININREGIFKGKHLLPKLERMGLIASEDSSVGEDPENGVGKTDEGWTKMFISRKSFWQLDARIYLFTMAPNPQNSPYPSMSPAGSRPASPNRNSGLAMTRREENDSTPGTPNLLGTNPGSGGTHLWQRSGTPPGPFSSGSHLPTFYPPPPPQYTFSNGIRHPIRPKPPRQGETFYTRWVPSLGQYLSFRVASLSPKPIYHRGPTSDTSPGATLAGARDALQKQGFSSRSDPIVPTVGNLKLGENETAYMSDTQLLHKWMNDPRVAYSWGEDGPIEQQEEFLRHGLTSRHSFPAIGCFDGKPFGFFEVYWVKEDRLSAHLDRDCGDWDRGLHVLVGEEEFRGPHRVRVWLSALVHYCWLADLRTNVVMMEPRVDNEKLLNYCLDVGFYKEKEVTFPHKQSNLLKIRRDAWECPAL